ncbi:MAG: hypothetical protein ACRD12_15810 [Acidimicrobiales bacterium]
MTDLHEAARQIDKEESRGAAALWFGVLGSPLAWAGHLAVNYSLEEWFACASSTSTRGKVLGLSVDTASIIFNTAMAAVALASLMVALSCRRKLRRVEGDDERIDRARFMALAGVVEGALFLGIILLGYLPPFLLDTCEMAP